MKISKSLNASVYAAIALAGVALAAPANASPVTWTITGTVNYVYDPNGILASNGVSVNSGDSAAFTWTFDTANSYTYGYSYDCGGCTYSYVETNNSGGAINAHFGGLTASASGDGVYGYNETYQYLSGYNYSGQQVEPYAYQYGYPGSYSYGSLTTNAPDPAAASAYYTQSQVYAYFSNYSNDPNAYYPGNSSLALFDASNYSSQYLYYYQNSWDSNWNRTGYLYVQASITDVQASDVPAPGALALLGLGLIGIGAVRRKKIAG